MSFQAKNTNPRACHSRRKTRSQERIIPAPDPESRGTHDIQDSCLRGILPGISSVSSLDLKIRSPLLNSLSCVIPGKKTAKSVSFPTKNTNPGAFHSRRKTRSQERVIPGADPESRGTQDFQDSCLRGILPGISSVSSLDLKIRSPLLNSLSVSFPEKNGQKRVISGEKHQSRSESSQA